MAAFEHDFAKEVPCHSIHPIKLTFISAKWTSIWILLEPVSFAIAAERFFTNDAFDRIFEHIIADTADQLRQEGFNMRFVKYFVLLETIFGVLFGFIYYTLHLFKFYPI